MYYLCAGINGHLANVAVKDIVKTGQKLEEFLTTQQQDLIKAISTEKVFSEESEETLKKALEIFKSANKELFKGE